MEGAGQRKSTTFSSRRPAQTRETLALSLQPFCVFRHIILPRPMDNCLSLSNRFQGVATVTTGYIHLEPNTIRMNKRLRPSCDQLPKLFSPGPTNALAPSFVQEFAYPNNWEPNPPRDRSLSESAHSSRFSLRILGRITITL